MPAELQVEAFSLKAWEWRRLQTSKFSPRELAAERWTSQSKDQVSQTALSSLQHTSLLLIQFWNEFLCLAFLSAVLQSLRYRLGLTKCIKCFFDFIRNHIACIIHPQLEPRSKWKCVMPGMAYTNVNISPLSLVNTPSASPGEASPSHAGSVLLMPVATH